MAAIPGFILKKLYVRGSLRNTPGGFEFRLCNHIASGTVTTVREVALDGQALPLSALHIVEADGVERAVSSVDTAHPFPFAMGSEPLFRVHGAPLAPGKHRLTLSVLTAEVGQLDIPLEDAVAEAAAAEAVREVEAPAEAPVGAPVLQPKPEQPAQRAIKIAIVGAGSAEFARKLMGDILVTAGLDTGTFALIDVDAERLELAQQAAERLVEHSGKRWDIEASTDRSRVLAGSHYVINTIEVAGLKYVRPDFEIPARYGVKQCIGDTIGPGGIFKALRTGPEWLRIVRDVERMAAPGALVLNYTNPMSILTLAALRGTGAAVVGLCHSVQGTSQQLAMYLDLPLQELRWRCAGINHMAWFTTLERRDGEDLYPLLRERSYVPEIYEADPVRFEIMRHFGAFVTESSGHMSEYVPYFRKRDDLIARYCREGYRGETGFYANNWPTWRRNSDDTVRAILAGRAEVSLSRSKEYAATIVEAVESNRPAVIHGNVSNSGLIDNLPAGACVEVPVMVNAGGLNPCHFGPLPPQLAGLNQTHISVHELVVQAILDGDRQAAYHALLLDPLTAAVCSPDEMRAMFDELWETQREDLQDYR